MPNSLVDSKFISDMLISQKGTINQNHPVGNWWFNSSLGRVKNNNFSSNGANLTEILWRVERGLSKFNIIPKIEHCDYQSSSIAYTEITKNKLKYWLDEDRANRVMADAFHIPMEHFEEFCTIIADSINTVYK